MSEPTVPPPPSYPPPPPPSSGMPGGPGGIVSPNRTIMIVLSYLWILALIPFLAEKEDREVQWHAKNGLLLTGAELLLWVALTMLSVATSAVDLGCTGCMLQSILGIVLLVIRVVAIIKGVGGGRLHIPVLSDYTSRF